MSAIFPPARPLLCTACFTDYGLRLDAERIGIVNALACPNCGARNTKKLTHFLINVLASQFFVRGSVVRSYYGSAPRVQFNNAHFGKGDYDAPTWLRRDVELIGDKGRFGFFLYGPRLWMLGEIGPLEALQDTATRDAIIARILQEYPERTLPKGDVIHRLRSNPSNPAQHGEYDSPPFDQTADKCGRLDAPGFPVLYCSQDIEGCVHECRVTVEDELYLATLRPTRALRLLDLTALITEQETEFESLDLTIHMLFFAAKHSYEISRAIAAAARNAGFDGLLYPSYFSQIRSGDMPYETVYGLSIRRFPQAAAYATSGIFANVALFGHPVRDGIVAIECINRLILHKARYEVRFGPASL